MNGYVFRRYNDPLDPRKGGEMVAVVAENEAAAHAVAWQAMDRYGRPVKPEDVHLVSVSTGPAALLWSVG